MFLLIFIRFFFFRKKFFFAIFLIFHVKNFFHFKFTLFFSKLKNSKKIFRISIVSNVEHGARFMEKGTVEINIDRMLNQDDGKGLGYSDDSIPIDLKPVDMKFRVVLEEMDEKKTSEEHFSTHTLHAQQTLQRTIYPPISLISRVDKEEDIEEIDKDSGLMFPCDVQMLTVRPLTDNRQLLIFYRHASSCVQKDFGKNCGAELKVSTWKKHVSNRFETCFLFWSQKKNMFHFFDLKNFFLKICCICIFNLNFQIGAQSIS